MSPPPSPRYDVVILGGALAGASTAVLLRRRFPALRVLVVERNLAFDWKVGESTVEMSGYFLSRVLKLFDYLSREQLPKQSFRYWFHNGKVAGVRDASEVGPFQLARLPAFQLDRSKLDEHVLALAVREGAELWRPAKVLDVALPEETGGPDAVVRVERGGEPLEVRCGWVVDASGRSAVIARKRGWLRPIEVHPTAAVWARFRRVKDLDGTEVSGPDPDDPYSRSTVAARRLATNHFVGLGYWMWFIPLQGGETSIGAVWDRRLVDPPGRTAEERLRWFLEGNPLTREITEGAELIPDDLRAYANLPYLIDRVAGPGWSLAGDAAGFLDPFYSPGLDQMCFSVAWTLELVRRGLEKPDPAEFAEEIRRHNVNYTRYLRYFFESIFCDKYVLMGDYDTMTASFLLDTSLYYFFTVWPTYQWKGSRGLLNPPFYHPFSKGVFPLIRFYQRRLVSIARRKLKLGVYGNHNAGRRPRLPGFSLGLGTVLMFLKGLRFWLRAEAENAWTLIARPRPSKAGLPGPRSTPEERAPGPEGPEERSVPVEREDPVMREAR
jgi:flavin-dependent dehydrogenase